MVPVEVPLLVAGLTLGVAALGLATWAVVRRDAPVPSTRASALAPLVPWLGSVLVVVLLVRGSWVAAVVVGVATVVHAALTRARTLARDRRR